MSTPKRPKRLYLRRGRIECTVVRPADEDHITCRVFVPLWGREIEAHYSDLAAEGCTLGKFYYRTDDSNRTKSFEEIRKNAVKLPEPENTTRGWLSDLLGKSETKLHGGRRR